MRGLKLQCLVDRQCNAVSHLLQMRGLKRLIPNLIILVIVASFTDAWIETRPYQKRYQYSRSHLLQMRGLKLVLLSLVWNNIGSHLLQMRGLKQQDQKYDDAQRIVASFTDAWIETLKNISDNFARLMSHLLQMRGLKLPGLWLIGLPNRRIFYRCVD